MLLGKGNGAATSAQQVLSREHSALSLLIAVCMVAIAGVTTAFVVRRVDRAEATILDAIDEDRARTFADTTDDTGEAE